VREERNFQLVRIKLWGTRGSLPHALTQDGFIRRVNALAAKASSKGLKTIDEFVRALASPDLAEVVHFGGNTTCSEISEGLVSLFVDSGTGITDACYKSMAEGRKDFHIFQTHMHWDHIMGLPFFVPIYIPGNKVTIYHVHSNAPDYIRILFNGVNFPVKWSDLSANIEFKHIKLYEPLQFGPVSVTPFVLDHPGGSFGYRFECRGKSLAIGVDSEFKRITAKELGKDLPFYQNLDLLVFDAQYEMDELASRFDWGHSSPPIGVDLALREGIRNLVLTHHDPRSLPDKCAQMVEHARIHCTQHIAAYSELWNKLGQPTGPKILSAYDGLEIDLHSAS
jgi:phosphoribosyl 1,2-cyclic phosphodiesterase